MDRVLGMRHESKFLAMAKFLAIVISFVFLGLATTAYADTGNKTLTVLVPSEFAHLDPGELLSGDQQMVQYHLYNRLYTFNDKLEPIRDLVVNESVSEDGTSWTFDIHPGVVFHDGTPCNAEAVKYTIDRMRKGKGRMQKVLFSPIKDVQVKSDTRLVIITNGMFPALKSNLGHASTAIVSPTADQKLGKDFGTQPVGAGPYRLFEWLTGDHITLVRNDKYYGERPFFDRIIFKFVGDATTRALMFETDQADVALRVLPTDIPRIEKNPSFKVVQVPGRNIFFTLNCARPPFNDINVRRAVNYAVDKQAIVDRILSGSGQPAHTVSGGVQYRVDAGFYDYDPNKAKTMIRDAGATGSKVLLVAPATRYLMDSEVAQAVAGYLREAGLDVTVQIVGDWPSYVDIVRRKDFDGHMMGLGAGTGDPDFIFRLVLHGDKAGKLWNAGSYSNPKVDQLIEEGSKEFDTAHRAKIYAEIQKLVWDDAPWLFLHRLTAPIAYKSDIRGIVVLPGQQYPYFFLAHR